MAIYNVNKTTGDIVETAGRYGATSAEEVSYDNTGSGLSATDVQGAVDEVVDRLDANILGTYVNISNYTSSNPYVIPSDGYVRLALQANGTGRIFINGQLLAGTERTLSYATFSVFVRKGMTAYMDTITNAVLGFFPLQ